MAVDLFCYVMETPNDTEAILTSLATSHQEIFSQKFLLSETRKATQINKEIALEYGIVPKSLFLVSLNDKSAADLVLQVANLIKTAFGKDRVVILHCGDVLV